MERGYWIMFIVIALVVGIVIGGGIGSKVSRVPELQLQIDQLTKENADLRAKLAAPALPAPGAGSTPTKASGQK